MHLSCIICSDLFTGTDPETVYATSCGHLFHYACLLEWFERSKSCPQCRHKQSERNITRVYFSLPSNTASDDTSILNNKVDSLSYQLKMKDLDIKTLKEAKGILEKQNRGLRQELKNMKDESQSNVSQLFAFKETISLLKKECKNLTEAKLEAEYLKNKINNYESIDAILNGPARDTDEVLARSMLDPMSLSMCVSSFKKELEVSKKQKLELRELVVTHQKETNKLRGDLKKINEEMSIFSRVNKKLKEDLLYSERDVKSLKQKIQELESAIISPSANNPRDKALRRMIQESPAPESIGSSQLNSSMFGTSPPDRTPDNISKPVTPSLPINSKKPDPRPSTIFKIPLRKLKPENIPLPRSDNSEQFYNGMGGHSKHDLFPTPRLDKFKKLTKKKNLSASAVPFSKKLKSDTNLCTLDSFITI